MTLVTCLELIGSNAYPSQRFELAYNARVREALAAGFIDYAPRRRVAYKLTEKGKVALSVARTGCPWPKKYVSGE